MKISGFDSIKQKLGKFGKDVISSGTVNDPAMQIIPSGLKFGVLPLVQHPRLYYYYLIDPGIQNSVNTFADQIIGSDYYITADDDALLTLVQEWFKLIKFKQKLRTFIIDGLITGNAMFQKLYQSSTNKLMDLDLVDMRIVQRIDPNPDNVFEPMTVVQRLAGKEITIDYDRIVHFKLFEISKMFLGIGLFHSLAVPQYEKDGVNHSILDDMQHMRAAFPQIIKRYASPKASFVYENENEAYIKKRAQEWKNLGDGETMFANKNFAFQEFKIDGNSRFDKYIELINLWYETGTQTPATKLQTTPGFTEASSRSALDLLERRINGRKSNLINVIEEQIIHEFLRSWGKSDAQIEKANIEFHFGLPETPVFDIQQLLEATNTVVATMDGPKRLVSWEECRNMFEKSGWILDPNSKSHSVPEEIPTIQRPPGGIRPEVPVTAPQDPAAEPKTSEPTPKPKDRKSDSKSFTIEYKGRKFTVTSE